MARSHRLFDLMQALRRHRRTVSGRALAQELGVSLRTIRRDVATLQHMGADIDGEPGVGYILRPGLAIASAGIPASCLTSCCELR
ncbi:HTH domain-containing protein [Paraburkholderia sp. BL17N1]|nr:HTH domain-containing protein [Paraburkholderia sp. BL17N1]